MTNNPSSQLTETQTVELGREVLARFPDDADEVFWHRDRDGVVLAQIPFVHAFSRHALRLGRVYLDVVASGMALESLPTLRAVFEHALTAVWLSESKEAVPPMFNREHRQRRALRESMSRSSSAAFREAAEEVFAWSGSPLETIADQQANSFEQLCTCLQPAGRDLYMVYRALCAHTHPSSAIADRYSEPDLDAEGSQLLLLVPAPSGHRSWSAIGVASMIWAARALDNMKHRHPDRRWLNGAAARLRIEPELTLTSEARRANHLAARERRQAKWKGPNPMQRIRDESRSGAQRGPA